MSTRSGPPLVAPVGARRVRWEGGDSLVVDDGPPPAGADAGSLGDLLVELAGLDAGPRAAVLDRLVAGCGDDPDAAVDLRRARDALRERHATVVVDGAATRGCSVEVLARVDATTWYLRGWVGHPDGALAALTLVSPLGERAELLVSSARYPRPDVDRFYGLEPRRGPDGLGLAAVAGFTHAAPGHGWLLEVRTRDGRVRELACPEAVLEPIAVRRLLLAELELDERGEDRVLRAVLHGALQRAEAARRARVAVASVDGHGELPEDPEVSVVVPLYGRLDFLEHQLAQWAHDPAMSASDLVYVLDQPEHADAFRAEARRLHRLYRVPFRLATVTENAGFSGANNLGAGLAVGRLLLLLNSDVLPTAPGWLPRLAAVHDGLPAVGAVAPRLVFEDGSLQHAGMYFERPDGERLWSNEHYFKGLRGDFPPASVTRPVPAVSAACLLTDRRRYDELGGLSGRYLRGDYEDSDLCLRLRGLGLDSWYAADVELLHLEGMSFEGTERPATSRYNQWLHTDLWDGEIAEVMADGSFRPDRVAAELAGGSGVAGGTGVAGGSVVEGGTVAAGVPA